jgi:hypothetical protein
MVLVHQLAALLQIILQPTITALGNRALVVQAAHRGVIQGAVLARVPIGATLARTVSIIRAPAVHGAAEILRSAAAAGSLVEDLAAVADMLVAVVEDTEDDKRYSSRLSYTINLP